MLQDEVTTESNAVGQFESADQAGRLLVCFDFEGSYGMPHRGTLDPEASARTLLGTLERYEAQATFFVVGRLAEEHPQVVSALAEAGHEIGIHGYDHDDLSAYDGARLARLDDDLARVESRIEEITGKRPLCFRAPYLLAPHFYRPEVSGLLRAHGYRWISNREIRYPVELLRPDRVPIHEFWRSASTGAPKLAHSPVLLAALNAGLVMRGSFGRSWTQRLRWLLNRRVPFVRDGLVEVPLYAPLDCDLLGMPAPWQDTPPAMLGYARAVAAAAATAPGVLSMVTFHDWIVGTGNRLVLLDDALAAARAAGVTVSTVAANPHWLPKPAD